MKEKLYLRCYKDNTEFQMVLGTNENISDQVCPQCHKQTVELDMGKPHKEIVFREQI
jgi:Zn finger protein HypA/HybF involved in hydrogenase expression